MVAGEVAPAVLRDAAPRMVRPCEQSVLLTQHVTPHPRATPAQANAGDVLGAPVDGLEPDPYVSVARVLETVRLPRLMARSQGDPHIHIGVIDGPVALGHPALAAARVRQLGTATSISCSHADVACLHGTLVTGALAASRGSPALSIAPGCSFLVRPIFVADTGKVVPAGAAPDELATAILECVAQGVRIINLSAAFRLATISRAEAVEAAIGQAARRGVLVVAAAGNQGNVGASPVTSHPWVIPVAACDLEGRPIEQSNLGISIARRGMLAPGHGFPSLRPQGGWTLFAGTSAATPLVTGTIALLWSEFPNASAAEVRGALLRVGPSSRRGLVPPLLDAWAAFELLRARYRG